MLQLAAGADPLAAMLAAMAPHSARIDLQTAPLLRAYLAADPASGQWLLVLLHHHIVCDHLTLELLVGEIHGILQGQEHLLAPAQPYRNFIAQLCSVPEQEHEHYFRAALGDIDTPTAPYGIMALRGSGRDIGEAQLALAPALAARLRACARTLASSPAPLFHLAWAQVLGRLCERDDVVFGTVLSGRMQGSAGADRVLGMFINTLPLRVKLQVAPAEALALTRRSLDELLGHEQASLALAQRCSQVPAPLPLFTSCLNYRHGQHQGSAAQEWEGMRLLGGQERTNYPLMVAVNDGGDAFSLNVQAVAGIDPQRIAAYFAQACEALVGALEQAAPAPVAALEVLPEAERHHLLHGLHGRQLAYPAQALAHRLFEQQAALLGDAPAVTCGESTLSYDQLNRRAASAWPLWPNAAWTWWPRSSACSRPEPPMYHSSRMVRQHACA